MTTEVFADGVGEVNIANGIVRINFVSFSGTAKDEKGNPIRELRQRVVVTPQGVLELYGAMQQVIDRLVQAGLIQRRPAEGTPSANLVETDTAKAAAARKANA
jgi:DNA-binding MarR family transcriptional regulator